MAFTRNLFHRMDKTAATSLACVQASSPTRRIHASAAPRAHRAAMHVWLPGAQCVRALNVYVGSTDIDCASPSSKRRSVFTHKNRAIPAGSRISPAISAASLGCRLSMDTVSQPLARSSPAIPRWVMATTPPFRSRWRAYMLARSMV